MNEKEETRGRCPLGKRTAPRRPLSLEVAFRLSAVENGSLIPHLPHPTPPVLPWPVANPTGRLSLPGGDTPSGNKESRKPPLRGRGASEQPGQRGSVWRGWVGADLSPEAQHIFDPASKLLARRPQGSVTQHEDLDSRRSAFLVGWLVSHPRSKEPSN